MATKTSVNTLASMSNETTFLAEINQNFTTIIDAIDLLVSRDGESPNTMTADLDVNSRRLLNLPDATTAQEPVTKSQLDAASDVTASNANTSNYTATGTGAIERTVQARLDELVNVKDFGAVGDGTTDDTAAIQAALDHANSLYLGGSLGGGGAIVYFPAARYLYTGLTLDNGVSLVGDGTNWSLLKLSGATSTGIKCAAAASGLSADQITWGKFEGLGFFSDETTPTSQVHWNMVGFSRWTVRNCYFEWFSGCTAVQMTGAALAGGGGPAQWYNGIYESFFIHPASRTSGGTAMDLGDDSTSFEKLTALTMIGGRVATGLAGTGIKLKGSGCMFIGVTFENLDVGIEFGSASTRGAVQNSCFGCYWENNTTDWKTFANAEGTYFSGSLNTGGTTSDLGSRTIIDNDGVHQGYAGSTAGQSWEVVVNSGSVKPAVFRGLTAFPAVALEDVGGLQANWSTNATASPTDDYHRFLDDGYTNVLFKFGTTGAEFKATSLGLDGGAVEWHTGTGSPESSVTASPGSLYTNKSGGASTTLYVKESGSGNTGWVAK